MNEDSTRGQITIFFIIGLVLLIVFGMLAYIAFDTVETQEGVTAQARNYLSSCVENTVYSYFDSLATANHYAILGPSVTSPEQIGIEQSLDELYGPIDSRYDDTTRSTLIGKRNLTPLCDPDGPNNREQTQNIRCFVDSYGPDSHQERLREEIKEDLIACSNEGNDEEIGTRIAEWPDPEVTVTFGKSATLVEAKYEDSQEIYTLDLSYDARLLQLYSFVEERLVMTTKDPRITVTNLDHAQQSTFYREGFIMSMQQEGTGWKYTFTDTNSNYRGTQLTISFLGEDRQPYEDINVELDEGETHPEYDPDTGLVQE